MKPPPFLFHLVLFALLSIVTCGYSFISYATEYSITIDDPHLYRTPLLTPDQRNKRILQHLRKKGRQAILFVCGKRIDHPRGHLLLRSWIREGHFLANHSYSHLYFHSSKISLQRYRRDVLRNHLLLMKYPRFLRLFRFPYLKEGNTTAKRDGMRRWMRENGYRNGHVTIDASDWYIDKRLRQKLNRSKGVNLQRYRDYYLSHMWERAQYYDGLAKQLLQRNSKHTILVHHNLLNALFLGDLIDHFKARGWKLISADQSYQDQLFLRETRSLPSGESIVWSLAREKNMKDLRYPAESDQYEKVKMDHLGL